MTQRKLQRHVIAIWRIFGRNAAAPSFSKSAFQVRIRFSPNLHRAAVRRAPFLNQGRSTVAIVSWLWLVTLAISGTVQPAFDRRNHEPSQ